MYFTSLKKLGLINVLDMCRFSGLNLSPEETPEMSFEADTCSLRQAITSFGNISTQVCEVSEFLMFTCSDVSRYIVFK